VRSLVHVAVVGFAKFQLVNPVVVIATTLLLPLVPGLGLLPVGVRLIMATAMQAAAPLWAALVPVEWAVAVFLAQSALGEAASQPLLQAFAFKTARRGEKGRLPAGLVILTLSSHVGAVSLLVHGPETGGARGRPGLFRRDAWPILPRCGRVRRGYGAAGAVGRGGLRGRDYARDADNSADDQVYFMTQMCRGRGTSQCGYICCTCRGNASGPSGWSKSWQVES